MSTQYWEASFMAWAASGSMIDPLRRVAGPEALMMVRTPSLSYTLSGTRLTYSGLHS